MAGITVAPSPGTYKIYSDNKLTELISITPTEKAQTVKIPISGSNVKVTIAKVQ